MINNLTAIKPRLEEIFNLNNPDLFFHVEVLQRKKENPDVNRNNNVICSYAIKNMEYLKHKLKNEIIPICDTLNARAMIDLNPKSFREVTYNMLRRVSEYIENEIYDGALTKLFDSCTSSTFIDYKAFGIEKYWILDVDKKASAFCLQEIFKLLYQYCSPFNKPKDEFVIYSKNGYHIITRPFDIKDYEILKSKNQEIFKDIEIKKNCLTNLYIKSDEQTKNHYINI